MQRIVSMAAWEGEPCSKQLLSLQILSDEKRHVR